MAGWRGFFGGRKESEPPERGEGKSTPIWVLVGRVNGEQMHWEKFVMARL